MPFCAIIVHIIHVHTCNLLKLKRKRKKNETIITWPLDRRFREELVFMEIENIAIKSSLL